MRFLLWHETAIQATAMDRAYPAPNRPRDSLLTLIDGMRVGSNVQVECMESKSLFQTVALLEDIPEYRLVRGQVGTVVENLAPDVYEVEFSDDDGRTYAMLALRAEQSMMLRFAPDKAA